MQTQRRRITRRVTSGVVASALVATALVAGSPAALAAPSQIAAVDAAALVAGPEPTVHTQQAYAPEDDFTAKWTRADARQLMRLSDPGAPSRENSMPASLTMPTVPQDFPDMSRRGSLGVGLLAAYG